MQKTNSKCYTLNKPWKFVAISEKNIIFQDSSLGKNGDNNK